MTQSGHGEAVLLLAHGGPESLDDLPRFLADVRGSAPSPQGLRAARERYAAIGGRSPMPAATKRIAGLLAETSGRDVAVGFRHSPPGIAAAVTDLAVRAPARIVALCMAPHFSHVGPGSYLRRCREAAAGTGLADRLVEIPDWHLADGLLSYWAQTVRTAVHDAESERVANAAVEVVFTAHSIPLDREPADSPY
ncbi:MAG: ferrochelatase, partial [Actinobacteria bacterium]|nr:ferrochelatase [Actinomycetota bacterium]